MEGRKRMIELLKHQHEFVEATEHEVMMLAPMAAGKTFAQLYDAKEFALKYPGSTQVYMTRHPVEIQLHYHDFFKDVAEFNKMYGCCEFGNSSKIFFSRYDETGVLANCSMNIEIYRIDVDIFDLNFKAYADQVLPRTYRPSEYPQAVKITAKDTLYSIANSERFKIIEPQEPINPYMMIPMSILEGEWIPQEKGENEE